MTARCRPYGRGGGVGRGRGEGVDLGRRVAVGVAVAGVPVAVGVGEGDPQGLTGQLKISIEAMMVRPSTVVAACFPDVIGAIGVGGEVAPRNWNGTPSDHVLLTGS